MKLAIISDLHADLPALDAALRHILDLKCNAVVCAGDLVDLGEFPNEVIARLAALHIPTVRGNHDRWALARANARDRSVRLEPEAEILGGGADLSAASLAFLANLPTSIRLELEGTRVVVWHASPGSDMRPVTDARSALEGAGADVLVVGHTHKPLTKWHGDRLVANPGALHSGEGRGGTFGVLELPSRLFRVWRASDRELVLVDEPAPGRRRR